MFKLLPLPAFGLAALFLLPAVSHSETLVNGSFDPPAITGQSYDPTAVAEGPAGKFTFIATFCNKPASQPLGNRLESRTATLTGGNELLNRTSGSGTTSVLAFPPTGGYADFDLAPGECVPVTYEIGLQQRAPFQFFVDIWFDAAVSLFSNEPYPSGQPTADIGRFVDDFRVGVRSDPLVPGPTIKGVKWKGSKRTFGIEPGKEFRMRIYQSTRCVPPPQALGNSPVTGYDAPIYEAVVTASEIGTSDVLASGEQIFDYTASIPEFTPTAGCRYFLLIENTSNAGGFDQGGWAWARVFDNNFDENQNAHRWDGSNWRIQDDRFFFELTD